MDRTKDFSRFVRSYRDSHDLATPKDEILRPVRARSLFVQSATTVFSDVLRVRDFLRKNRAGYVGSHHYWSGSSVLSDAEKDEIDDEASHAIAQCSSEIDRLGAHVSKVARTKSENAHTQQHLNGVVMYLYEMLSTVNDGFGKLKAARFNNVVADLSARYRPSPSSFAYDAVADAAGESEQDLGLDDLGDAEREELQAKTQSLYRSLGDELDMVRHIEKQVVAIASLQQQLSVKVLEQQEAIDHLESITVESVALVESGVDQLRQAQRSVSDYRLIVLATLIILSFTLLFLHWYT